VRSDFLFFRVHFAIVALRRDCAVLLQRLETVQFPVTIRPVLLLALQLRCAVMFLESSRVLSPVCALL
jgi:hypothetical protein